MRFKYHRGKSWALKHNPKRGIGFDEAQELFEHPYAFDQRSEVPEQYRAIGWIKGRLFSVIFEIREDADGEYYHLVTLWPASEYERELYEENY